MKTLWRLIPAFALLAVASTVGYALLNYPSALNATTPEAMLSADEKPVTKPRAQPDARPERVVLVVLDGLRLDVSEGLPGLIGLRLKGLNASAQAPTPSFSKPGYAAMATGASPWRAGIRTNATSTPVPADTVFARIRQAGMTLRGSANHPYWPEVFKDQFNRWWVVPSDAEPEVFDRAMADILSEDADLTVLHIIDIDKAGHNFGAAHENYFATATNIDQRLTALLARVDLNRDLLIVTADHGHLEQGGHGGAEPEVRAVPLLMAGRGVKPGKASLGPLEGLGPTLALMLGVEFPRDMNAAPYTQALDPAVFGAGYLKARQQEWNDHRVAYERKWLERTHDRWTSTGWGGESIGNDVSDATQTPEGASLSALIDAREATLAEIDRDRRVGRTPLVALVGAVFIFLIMLGLGYGYQMLPMLALPTFGGSVGGAFLAMGNVFSFSAVDTRETFLTELVLIALVSIISHFIVLEVILRIDPRITRKGGPARPCRAETRRFHIGFAALCYLATVPTLWLLMGYNIDAPLPDPELLFAPMFAGVTSITFALVALFYWVADVFIRPRTPAHAAVPRATPHAQAKNP